MKIKLALLDNDTQYLNRIVAAISVLYTEQLELYSFTDTETALSELEAKRIQVFLASQDIPIDQHRIPKQCGFAFLVALSDVDTLNGVPAVCKFQSLDNFYRQVLNIFSETSAALDLVSHGSSCRTLLFSSPCGGTGTSSMAAGCAMYFATRGQKTLYLNLEIYGSSELYFHADGAFDFSNVIYAAKSRESNLSMKLESCIRQDASGVYFYAPTQIALDMQDLHMDEMERIISVLQRSGYTNLVIDMDFGLDAEHLSLMHLADRVVWVSDGSSTATEKTSRALHAVQLSDTMNVQTTPLAERLCLCCNRCPDRTSIQAVKTLNSFGRVSEIVGASVGEILSHISKKDFFSALQQD